MGVVRTLLPETTRQPWPWPTSPPRWTCLAATTPMACTRGGQDWETVPVLSSFDPSLIFPFHFLPSRYTLPDFPSVDSLPYLFCCNRTTVKMHQLFGLLYNSLYLSWLPTFLKNVLSGFIFNILTFLKKLYDSMKMQLIFIAKSGRAILTLGRIWNKIHLFQNLP